MEIPNIGLGFWEISKSDAKRVVKEGIEVGYRHIDTAIAYQNEKEIGEGLKEINLSREDLWITSKIPAEIKNYEEAKKAIDDSLERLGCKYLDLMLIHAPKPWALMPLPGPRFHKGNLEVWKALCEAKKEGKVKNIGVSNYSKSDLKNIMDHSDETIFANQIRVHVGHVPKKVIDFCHQNNIIVEAYSPNGRGSLIKNKTINEIAKKHGVSAAQICVAYDLSINTYPLPRSKSKGHMQQNNTIPFKLDESDIKKLNHIKTF